MHIANFWCDFHAVIPFFKLTSFKGLILKVVTRCCVLANKILRLVIIWAKHRHSQGVGKARNPPFLQLKCHSDKNVTTKHIISSVSCSVFAYNTTRINADDHGARVPSTFPTNLMYNLKEVKGFCPKSCNITPSTKLFKNVMQ